MKHNTFSFHFYADEDKEESSMGCVGGKEGALYAEVTGKRGGSKGEQRKIDETFLSFFLPFVRSFVGQTTCRMKEKESERPVWPRANNIDDA